MPELTPEIAQEAMLPWLSRESFKICGETVQIKPLSVRNQMRFMQIVRPVLAGAAEKVDETMLWTAGAEVLAYTDVMPELIHLMCVNDGKTITLDQILDSDIQMDELGRILLALAAKNEGVGRPVLDFFSRVWPLLSGALTRVKNQVPDLLKAKLSFSLDSSAESASVSDGALSESAT